MTRARCQLVLVRYGLPNRVQDEQELARSGDLAQHVDVAQNFQFIRGDFVATQYRTIRRELAPRLYPGVLAAYALADQLACFRMRQQEEAAAIQVERVSDTP